jgi:hypothetical protein
MEQVSWSRWINAIVTAAKELREAGFSMERDPSADEDVFYNLLALSAAEWRKGDQVNLEGPGMGKALGGEESYSPLQIFMDTWGEDTSDRDVTVINNEFVPEFQNIDKDDLISLITTDVDLAAKAAIIVLNSNNGYENWSTWSMVQDPKTPQYMDYAKQFSNDLTRGGQFDDDVPPPVDSTTTTSTTTTTMPPMETDTVQEPQEYFSQVPKQAPSFEEARYQTRINRLSPEYKKDNFLKYFDTVTSFRKKDPSTFKERSVAKPTEINFMGTPVTTQEIIDLLEP